MVEELPVGYYLDNFDYLLDFVAGLYGDILDAEEIAFRDDLQSLSLDARRLYVRLCSRKGPIFRTDKLAYDEIDVPRAVQELVSANFADHAEDADCELVLGLLTRPELAALPVENVPRSAKRPVLVEHILSCIEGQDLHAILPFRMVRPLKLTNLQVYKLLFFGNAHQDFTEFVLHELGITPYETYTIHPEDRFFDDRGVLEQTLALYALSELAHEAVAESDIEAMNALADAVPRTCNESLARRAGKIRNHLARQFERLDEHARALELYRMSDVAPSRERQARIWEKAGDIDASLALCRDIIENPEDEAEFEFAVSFARRVSKREGRPYGNLPDPGSSAFDTAHIVVPEDPAFHVEELARRWFDANGNKAWYVENGLFPGLFGLAFWDIIFAPRKGVFFNPFQRGPADLFTPDFKDAMREPLRRRIAELAEPAEFKGRVLDAYAQKYPVANHFVNWNVLDEALLDAVFERVPVGHALSVFERMLRDLRNNRSGFPDLVVFPDAGEYLLAEIKGPGDTLQDNQKRWLRYFRRVGVPAQVVNVSWHMA